jgi:hypothetical protein
MDAVPTHSSRAVSDESPDTKRAIIVNRSSLSIRDFHCAGVFFDSPSNVDPKASGFVFKPRSLSWLYLITSSSDGGTGIRKSSYVDGMPIDTLHPETRINFWILHSRPPYDFEMAVKAKSTDSHLRMTRQPLIVAPPP